MAADSRRRSQKSRMFAPRFLKLLRRLPLPGPTIINPYQDSPRNIASGYSREEPSARKTHARICEGGAG